MSTRNRSIPCSYAVGSFYLAFGFDWDVREIEVKKLTILGTWCSLRMDLSVQYTVLLTHLLQVLLFLLLVIVCEFSKTTNQIMLIYSASRTSTTCTPTARYGYPIPLSHLSLSVYIHSSSNLDLNRSIELPNCYKNRDRHKIIFCSQRLSAARSVTCP